MKGFNYTEDYDEWFKYMENNCGDMKFIYPPNVKNVGKYCIGPQGYRSDEDLESIFTVKSRLIEGSEENLNNAINEFEILYCVFEVISISSFIEPTSKSKYMVRGVPKESKAT